jgi:hypothetical protein
VDPSLFVRVIVDLDGAAVGDLSDLSLFEGGSFASRIIVDSLLAAVPVSSIPLPLSLGMRLVAGIPRSRDAISRHFA